MKMGQRMDECGQAAIRALAFLNWDQIGTTCAYLSWRPPTLSLGSLSETGATLASERGTDSDEPFEGETALQEGSHRGSRHRHSSGERQICLNRRC